MTALEMMQFVSDYEEGRLTQAEVVVGFQALTDADLIWGMSDSLVAQAESMIDVEMIHT